MTEEQRITAFRHELITLSWRYGVEVRAIAQSEQLGDVVQTRGVIRLQTRADWTPPENAEE